MMFIAHPDLDAKVRTKQSSGQAFLARSCRPRSQRRLTHTSSTKGYRSRELQLVVLQLKSGPQGARSAIRTDKVGSCSYEASVSRYAPYAHPCALRSRGRQPQRDALAGCRIFPLSSSVLLVSREAATLCALAKTGIEPPAQPTSIAYKFALPRSDRLLFFCPRSLSPWIART